MSEGEAVIFVLLLIFGGAMLWVASERGEEDRVRIEEACKKVDITLFVGRTCWKKTDMKKCTDRERFATVLHTGECYMPLHINY